MIQLEDKIKDRLEGYVSSLPEDDFAEFGSLLDNAVKKGSRRSLPGYAWLAPAAVAAGLALFFLLGQNQEPETIQIVENGTLVADVIEPAIPDKITDDAMIDVRTVDDRKPRNMSSKAGAEEDVLEKTIPVSKSEETTNESVKSEPDDSDKHTGSRPAMNSTETSPFVPVNNPVLTKPVSANVGKAAASVLGGSGAVALASILPSVHNDNFSGAQIGRKDKSTEKDYDDYKTRETSHHMPVHAGLSLRVPLNDRWSITTGIDYLLYSSEIGYSVSGFHRQNAHYIEVPARADYTIARNRWLDIYVGAGVSVDCCVAAYDAGCKIAKDGIGFSVLGAGGIQFNVTDHLGLFLDPTLSWSVPSGNRVLDTYRTEHPLMFSVSTGIRFTLQNKK